MSDYHWNTLSTYRDQIKNSEERFFFSDIRRIARDKSILLPYKLRDNIGTGNEIFSVLCFVDRDDILPYPYRISCIHPKHTSLLGHLVDENPDKWFWWTIDRASRLHLPIDTLNTIRITKEAFISAFDELSWSVMDPDQEVLSYRTYVSKLNSGEISIPEELLRNDKHSKK